MSACEAPLSAGRVPSCPLPPAQHWCACSGSSQQTPRLGRPRLLLGAPQLSQALSLLPPSAPEAMKILRALAAWAGHAPDSGTAPRVGARGRREAEERARLHSVPRTLSPREDRLATCSSGPACGEIWGWRVIRGTSEVPTPPAAAAPARGSLQSALSSRSLGRLSPRPWPWLRLGPGLARPCPHVARLRTESRSGLARSQ